MCTHFILKSEYQVKRKIAIYSFSDEINQKYVHASILCAFFSTIYGYLSMCVVYTNAFTKTNQSMINITGTRKPEILFLYNL